VFLLPRKKSSSPVSVVVILARNRAWQTDDVCRVSHVYNTVLYYYYVLRFWFFFCRRRRVVIMCTHPARSGWVFLRRVAAVAEGTRVLADFSASHMTPYDLYYYYYYYYYNAHVVISVIIIIIILYVLMTLFNCRVPSALLVTTHTSYCFFLVFPFPLPIPHSRFTSRHRRFPIWVSFSVLTTHADGRGDAQTTTTTRRRMRV